MESGGCSQGSGAQCTPNGMSCKRGRQHKASSQLGTNLFPSMYISHSSAQRFPGISPQRSLKQPLTALSAAAAAWLGVGSAGGEGAVAGRGLQGGLHSLATGPPANLAPSGESLGLCHAREGITWHLCFQRPPAQKVTCQGRTLPAAASQGHTACHRWQQQET